MDWLTRQASGLHAVTVRMDGGVQKTSCLFQCFKVFQSLRLKKRDRGIKNQLNGLILNFVDDLFLRDSDSFTTEHKCVHLLPEHNSRLA